MREWLLQKAFPTINYRLPAYQGKKQPFPFDKYFGLSNNGGVGLLMLQLEDLNDFGPQFRAVRHMRPYIEQLSAGRPAIRFAVLEKSESTLEMRKALKVGLEDLDELVVFRQLHGLGRKVDNFYHGNDQKYRLTNFSELEVSEFFGSLAKGTLQTYWASLDAGRPLAPNQLRGSDLLTLREKHVLVAFLDVDCLERGRTVWDAVAKAVQMSQRMRQLFELYWLDQSRDEHPENLVPGRLGEPMVMYYPPGSKKRVLHQMSRSFDKESILEMLEDLAADSDEL